MKEDSEITGSIQTDKGIETSPMLDPAKEPTTDPQFPITTLLQSDQGKKSPKNGFSSADLAKWIVSALGILLFLFFLLKSQWDINKSIEKLIDSFSTLTESVNKISQKVEQQWDSLRDMKVDIEVNKRNIDTNIEEVNELKNNTSNNKKK